MANFLSLKLIASSFSIFIDLLVQPGVLPIIHQHFESKPELQGYPYALVHLSLCFDSSKEIILPILRQTLTSSNPHLLFRNDNINILILREFTVQTTAGLSKLLKPILTPLRARRLSFKRLHQRALNILQTLNDYSMPLELCWLYSLVNQTIAHRFPGMESLAMSTLFFLRFFYPLILNFFSRKSSMDSDIYRENSTQVVKMIQSFISSAFDLPANLDGISSKKGRQSIKLFLARLAGNNSEAARPLPASFPSLSVVDRFFQMINQEEKTISQSFASIGSLAPENLTTEWAQFIDSSMQIVDLLSQSPSSPIDNSVRNIEATISFGDISFSHSTSSSHSFSQTDLSPMQRNESIENFCSFNSPSSSDSDTNDSLPQRLLLLSVPSSMPVDFPTLFPSKEQIETWDNATVLKWLEINRLEDIIPSFEEQGITGYDLTHGSFGNLSIPDGTRDRFIDVYNQLQRNSLDVFNESAFLTPQEHIKSLQAVVNKMAMLLNPKLTF